MIKQRLGELKDYSFLFLHTNGDIDGQKRSGSFIK